MKILAHLLARRFALRSKQRTSKCSWSGVMLVGFLCSIISPAFTQSKAQTRHQVNPQVKDVIMRQVRPQPVFSNVVVNGDIDVTLTPSTQSQHALVLCGMSSDLAHIITRVAGSTLYVDIPSHFPRHQRTSLEVVFRQLRDLQVNGNVNVHGTHLGLAPTDLTLNTDGQVSLLGPLHLRHLAMTGKAHVVLKRIQSRNTTIDISGAVEAELEGVVHLSHLSFADDSKLRLRWVDAADLSASGKGHATVVLAGIADGLHLVTHHHAQFDARYLRVKRPYVTAEQYSLIRVQPLNSLHAIAKQRGRVFYADQPRFVAAFMHGSGTVLHLLGQ